MICAYTIKAWRLGTQGHPGNHSALLTVDDLERAPEALDTLEQLLASGKVRTIGWNTDDPERTGLFAASPHCVAIQQSFSLFEGNEQGSTCASSAG